MTLFKTYMALRLDISLQQLSINFMTRDLPKPPKPGTYREPGSVIFSKPGTEIDQEVQEIDRPATETLLRTKPRI